MRTMANFANGHISQGHFGQEGYPTTKILFQHNNNNNKGPLILAFDICTCFTLLYIVQLFLTFTDVN